MTSPGATESFEVAPAVLEEIIAHARAGYPEEVCGLVAGPLGRGDKVYRGRNVAGAPQTSFQMDVATLAQQVTMEEQGLSLTAIYHSHPQGPARPSPADVAQAYYPDAVQIICSLLESGDPVVRAYRICDGCVWEVRLLQIFDS